MVPQYSNSKQFHNDNNEGWKSVWIKLSLPDLYCETAIMKKEIKSTLKSDFRADLDIQKYFSGRKNNFSDKITDAP